jgi:hypothetical protein
MLWQLTPGSGRHADSERANQEAVHIARVKEREREKERVGS